LGIVIDMVAILTNFSLELVKSRVQVYIVLLRCGEVALQIFDAQKALLDNQKIVIEELDNRGGTYELRVRVMESLRWRSETNSVTDINFIVQK